jgi:hypothetical protein
MKMKRKLLIASVAFALSLIACTKANKEVFIRVENATSEDFSNFTFAGTDFGGIAKGDTTMYHQFEKILPYPFANDLTINNNYLYIEDLLHNTPFLENGKYLLRVVDDTDLHYKASFIRE